MNKRFRGIAASALFMFALTVVGACSHQDTPPASTPDTPAQQQSVQSQSAKAPTPSSSPNVTPKPTQSHNKTKPTAAPQSASPKGGCSPAETALSLKYDGGAAGSTYYVLMVTNKGTVPCQLGGYPGVSATDASGRQIGQPAQRENDSWDAITLQPGKSATAALRVTNPDNLCPQEQAESSQIRVSLPERRDDALIEGAIRVCTGQQANLTISAFTAQE